VLPDHDTLHSLRKIKQNARRLLGQISVSIREITQFVAKTTAAIRLAPLNYRALQEMLNFWNYSQEEITNNTDTDCGRPQLVQQEYRCPLQPSIMVHSDVYWRATKGDYCPLRSSSPQSCWQLQAFGETWQSTTALLHMDNITVSYVNQTATLPTGHINMELVQQAKDLPPCRTSTKSPQHTNRQGVRDHCDWKLVF